ncbi:sensor histidine kinase [Sphaerisporangium sp. NPDC049003]|uniref:sensor histidine kinase n=1 Tax=Sphaerisporangium sp. NPDC049003 TaxID=3364517 RepID=UPI00371F25F8
MTDLRECIDELDKLEDSVTSMRAKLNQEIRRQRRFAADASHELRTPLAGLRVQLEEARRNPDDTDLDSLLAQALSSVDRLQAIVSDLFVLAQLEACTLTTDREPVDLTKLVQEQVYKRVDRHEVELRLEPGVVVDAAPIKITRMIAELLDNAQRHARLKVRIELGSNADTATLTVADDGRGVADEDRQRIFDRFIRLDEARSRDRGGTGLGLTIARDIISAHTGTIEVGDSALGGARFVVRLPLAERSTHPDPLSPSCDGDPDAVGGGES